MVPPLPSSKNSLADLLREAGAAARAGDASEAARLYRRVLDRSPANVEAWLGLGAVLTDPQEKATCFQRVLEIDPGNQDAAASLERLRAVLPVSAESQPMECAFHPGVKTVLRCSQCGRPICVRCANPYPVGQLCPICVRGRRPEYYQPGLLQLAAAGTATFVAAAVAGFLASLLQGFLLFVALLGGPLVGSLLAQLALRVGQRRRGRAVQITVGTGVALGSFLGGMLFIPWFSLSFLFFLVYVAMAVGSAVAWLR
jgi:tetratricopeptide (TPR) repeat protein